MAASIRKPSFDCVVFIALKEEADIFRQTQGLRFEQSTSDDGLTISPFQFIDHKKAIRHGHLIVIGEMGPQAALSTAERVLGIHDYDYAFSIGLSGRVSNDVRLGDVVFGSEEVFDYGQRMKAESTDEAGWFRTEIGQRTTGILPTISTLARNFGELHPLLFGQWSAQAKHDFNGMITAVGGERLERIKALLGKGATLEPARLVAGPVASGPFVGKAEAFRDLIAQKHNSVLAIDMESGAIARACTRSKAPKLIILRAVSDPVARKTELDQLTNGGLRGYSMRAAGHLAAMLLQKVLIFERQPTSPRRRSTGRLQKPASVQASPDAVARALEAVEQVHINSPPFNFPFGIDYSSPLDVLFSANIVYRGGEKPDQSVSAFAASLLEDEADRVFWISGSPGTGRSTLARLLWYHQKSKLGTDANAPVPVYINLASREAEAMRRLGEPIATVLNELVHQDTVEIFDRISDDRKITLIIDGFEQKTVFRRGLLERYIRAACRDRAKDVILVFDRRLIENDSAELHSATLEECGLDNPSTELRLQTISIDSPNVLAFVEAVLSILPVGDRIPTSAQTLVDMARRLDLRSLDMFLVGVMVSRQKIGSSRPISSTILLLEYYHSQVRQIAATLTGAEVYRDKSDLASGLGRLGADLAFAMHTQSDLFELVDPDHRDDGGKIDQTELRKHLTRAGLATDSGLQACAAEVYALVRSHRMLSSVLVADHGLRVLEAEGARPVGDRDWTDLDFVYPTMINRCFKHLMLRAPGREATIARAAIAIMHDTSAPPLARAHVAYLLGRVSTRNVEDKARSALMESLGRFDTSPRDEFDGIRQQPRPRALPLDRQEVRHQLLFRRSVMISLAVLGDEDVAFEYIRRTLEDHEEDRVNRGFHLEYYGDVPFTPEIGLAHHDDLSTNGAKTLAELDRRIRRSLDERAQNGRPVSPNTHIEIATYGSIVQHRHIAQRLAADQRGQAKLLLDTIISRPSATNSFLRTYVCMLRRNLEVANYNQAHLLRKFFRLKDEQRAGWLERRAAGTFKDGIRIESVTDHLAVAMLIAFFYLPQQAPPGMEQYDKNEILLSLLIHDLGEAFTGDHTPNDKYNRELEKLWSIYISRMATYERIHGVAKFYSLFDAFFNQSTLEARIARDIDRLENLAQLYVYREQLTPAAFEAFEGDLVPKIVTEAGQYIRETLRGLRDGYPDEGDFLLFPRFQ